MQSFTVSDASISGLGRHTVIFGCRSWLKSFGSTVFELADVAVIYSLSLRFAV